MNFTASKKAEEKKLEETVYSVILMTENQKTCSKVSSTAYDLTASFIYTPDSYRYLLA